MYGRKVKLRFFFILLIITTLALSVFLLIKSLEENVIFFKSPTEIKTLSEIGKKKIPNLQIIAFKITNLFHRNIEKRFESLITQTAEERYVDLVKNHPKIINSISLKMIASYLGITDVALSRIRSRLAKKRSANY